MAFLKKYPLLVATLAILLAICIAQIVFVYIGWADTDKAHREYEQAQRQLNSLVNAGGQESLALTQVNVEKIQEAVQNGKGLMAEVISGLGGQNKVLAAETAPANGRDMLFSMQGFVDELRKAASQEDDIINPETGLTESKAQVDLAPNMYFGFGYYMGADVQPPSDASVPALFQQRQILEYLIRSLYAARPKNQVMTLVSVEREVVSGEAISAVKDGESRTRRRAGAEKSNNTPEVFQINPLVSARVDGAITAMAFRIKFIGYTDALRNFLNQLGKFELPLVVRSVEVQPAAKSVATRTRREQNKPAGFDALFGGSSTTATTADGKPFVPKAPIISENLSEFTVVIEYFSITDASKKASAPQPAQE